MSLHKLIIASMKQRSEILKKKPDFQIPHSLKLIIGHTYVFYCTKIDFDHQRSIIASMKHRSNYLRSGILVMNFVKTTWFLDCSQLKTYFWTYIYLEMHEDWFWLEVNHCIKVMEAKWPQVRNFEKNNLIFRYVFIAQRLTLSPWGHFLEVKS